MTITNGMAMRPLLSKAFGDVVAVGFETVSIKKLDVVVPIMEKLG